MQQYMDVLQSCGLFAGSSPENLFSMLHCLQPRLKECAKGETLLAAGTSTDSFAVVLRGSVLILHEDYWGNRNILAALEPGELFAETFAATPEYPLSVSAAADAPSTVLFLNMRRVLSTCPSACPHHRQLIENLLAEMAVKNRRLNEKLMHMSQRSTRQKLLSYLSAEAQRRKAAIFNIPFNRQQLADYLSVDRSALSTELGKLKAEGLLDFHRNTFRMIR